MSWALFILLGATGQETTPDWRIAQPTEATASSYLQSAYNRHDENYHPRYVLDDSPQTAWTEGAAGHGEGEWLALHFASVGSVSAVRLSIRNGYQKSDTLRTANAAPREVRVTLRTANGRVHHTGLHTLTRDAGWQTLILEPAQPLALAELRIALHSVYPGQTYADACISDVRVEVVSDALDEAAQQAGNERITDWIAQRQAEADGQAPRDPFASRSFVQLEERVPHISPEIFSSLQTQLASTLKNGALLRGEAITSRDVIRQIYVNRDKEVSRYPSERWHGIDYLIALEGVHFSETGDAWRAENRVVPPGTHDNGNQEFFDEYNEQLHYTRSNLRVTRASGRVTAIAGQIRFANWEFPAGSAGRWYTSEMERQYLITYDAHQRAERIVLHDTRPDYIGWSATEVIELIWSGKRLVAWQVEGTRFEAG